MHSFQSKVVLKRTDRSKNLSAPFSLKLAVMDLVVQWPGTCHVTHVDVTVRCPHASRYAGAQCHPGTAAAGGDRDKRARYGSRVCPASVETYGRFGSAALETLAKLAQEAKIFGHGFS